MANTQKSKKKNHALPLLAAGVLVVALAMVLLPAEGGAKRAAEDGGLTIPTASVTQTASFYPVSVDGTEMEVLAIRTAAGDIRTAMNTCQTCYGSGKGYYKADGTELVCQNCGFRFTAERVGAEGSGGCNPWPITAAEREETDSEIRIPYETLLAAKTAFANWKK